MNRNNDDHSAADDTRPTKSASTVAVSSDADYSNFYGTKIEVVQDCPMYVNQDGQFVEAGTFKQGSLLDIVEGSNPAFLSVEDSPYYISGANVKASDRWFQNTNHLVAYNEVLHTNPTYELQDVNGKVVFEATQAMDYSVYVKPSAEDPRYGVSHQNELFYIPQDQGSSEATSGDLEPLASEVPVLMYHFFYSEANGETRTDANYVEVNELNEQLDWLQQEQYATLNMREIEYFMEGRAQLPQKSVAITIDDGDASVYKYAHEIIRDHGMHATLFVVCGWQPATMSYEMWEMREDGIELQSHSFLMHQSGCPGMGHSGALLCVDHDAGVQDTRESFDYVDGGFVYCYPFGDFNESAKTILRDAGAKLAFTVDPGKVNPSMDPLELPRVRVHGGNALATYQNAIQN